jgi:hypothetical protein
MEFPTQDQFFSRQDPSKPDIAYLEDHFIRQGRLSEEQALWILEKGTEVLRSEGNVLQVEGPLTGNVLSLPNLQCGEQAIRCIDSVATSLWKPLWTIC